MVREQQHLLCVSCETRHNADDGTAVDVPGLWNPPHDRDVNAPRNLLALGVAALSRSTASSAECEACGEEGETGFDEAGS